MKIRSQFITSLVVFGVVLLVTVASVILAIQQTANLSTQKEQAARIQSGATNLNYLSNYYFLYQEDLQIVQWHSAFNSLSDDVSSLKTNNPAQQTLVNNLDGDLQNLASVFENVVSYLQNAPRNVSVRIDPQFQTQWIRMALQNQQLATDASQLSQAINNQADQLNQISTALVFILFGTFGIYFLAIYLLIYRRALNSISHLQAETKIIGEGNLDHRIKIDRQDEIGELSQAFNQMTTNLKTVTTCKADLENEVAGRKLAETALRESEQRWSTTLSSIGDAVIATDLSGKVMFMNGVAEELTGWKLSEAALQPVKEVFNIVNEQTRREVGDPVSKVLEKGTIVGLANHTVLIRKNKTEVAIDDSGAPINDKYGKTTGVVLIFRDITERKKAEEALKQSEQLYHTVFDNSQDGFQLIELIYDENGKPVDHKFLRVNRAYEKITGVNAEEIIGKTAKHISSNCEPYWFEVPARVVKTRTTEHVELYNKDLNKYLDCYYFPYAENTVGTLFRDITERKKLEKQLKDSERLAAIGATAGMVGHDIRNPLQAIIGDVYLAKGDVDSLKKSEEKESLQESLAAIEKNIEYINKIVADLQDFARPLKPHVEETDLTSIIDDLLTKNKLPDNIKPKVKIKKATQTLTTDPAYMKRMLGNLISNAVQAMPNGGTLTITVTTKNDNVIITVQDTGVGIPDDVKPKLFTPLFTTKSKGQGFGLAVVKRMTEALNGTVTLESQQGKGTTFTITLPHKH